MGNKASLGSNVSEFSLRLYQQLSSSQNLVFSPSSIYIALAMVAIGSQKSTLQEFKNLLQFNSTEQLAKDTNSLQSSLAKTRNGITTQIANKIYQGLPQLGKEFEELMTKNFGSAIESVDFALNFEQIRLNINEWVLKSTNEKIKDLLAPGTLDSLTRMVLVNAIYFKGEWQSQFDTQFTFKSDFALEYENDGAYVQVQMMQKEEKYDYFETKTFKYVSIPYKGGEYAMEIILPNESLQKFEKTISHSTFLESRKSKINTKINLQVPKFKIEASKATSLKEILSQLGISTAFSDDANFSFMDPKNSIKVSDVYHKAMIEVNEEGAEAAAATATVMTLRCAVMLPQFECNKPFIYSITHIPTSTIMFLGKVTNPSKN